MRAFAVRAATAFAALMLAALVGVGALGFATAALYLGLRQVLSPALSALLTAAILLLIGLFVLLIARLFGRVHRATPTVDAAARATDIGQMAATFFSSRAQTLWQPHARNAVALAFAAGLVIGFSPRLRRALLRSLRDPHHR